MKPRLLVVSDCPTQEEVGGCAENGFTRELMCGATGGIFKQCLELAGLSGWDVEYTTLFPTPARDTFRSPMDVTSMVCVPIKRKEEVKAVDRLYFKSWPAVDQHIDQLLCLVERYRPTVILCLGAYSMWALNAHCVSVSADKGYYEPKAGRWRGSQEQTNTTWGNCNLMFSWHPDLIRRQWSMRPDLLNDLGRIAKQGEKPWDPPVIKAGIRPNFIEVEQWSYEILALLADHEMAGTKLRLAVDIETRAGFIACIGFARSASEALCIPFICQERAAYWTVDEEVRIIQLLRRILSHPAVMIVGQNYIYDAQYIANQFFVKRVADSDTLIMQHLCWPSRGRGLDYLSSLYADFHQYWKDEGKHFDDLHLRNEDEYWTYNCKDCCITWEISIALEQLIADQGLSEQLKFQMKTVQVAFDFMMRGVKVDKEARGRTLLELQQTRAEYAAWFDQIIDESIWPIERFGPRSAKAGQPKKSRWWDSTHQQQDIFYDLFGVAPVKSRKSKRGTTIDDAALEKLKVRDPLFKRIFQRLQEYRSLTVFGNMLSAQLDPDGRMRSSFDPAGTETFRFSSSQNPWDRGMNMQNIPSGLEEDEVVV